MNHYFHISLVEYLFKLAYYLPQCGILMKIPEGYKISHGQSLLLDRYVVKKFLRSDQHEGRTWDPGVDFLDHNSYNLKKFT